MDKVGEAELLAAASAGQILDCGDGDNRRPVDAALVRRCCHQLKDQIDPRGVQLRNATIAGILDLADLDVPFPLRFDDCEFDSPVRAEGARFQELALTRCPRIPGLLANGLRVGRDLDLSGSQITGAHRTTASFSRRAAVWLCEAEIGGRLRCVDTVIDPGGERSIQADRMKVGSSVWLRHRFTALGYVRLIGARIDGNLDLSGALIESATGRAVNLDDAVIGGSVFVINDPGDRSPVIRGRIDMGNARVAGRFVIRNLTLVAPMAPADARYARPQIRGSALSAPRLSVGTGVTMEGSCRVDGGMDLSMSELGSLYIGPGCSLYAGGRTALDLTNAELLSTFTLGEGVPVKGTVRLSGARIHGNLCLRGANLSDPDGGFLIAAQGLQLDGAAELQNMTATGGELEFRSATTGSALSAAGAQLHNPDGYTLNLVQANIKGSVRLTDDFESIGSVTLDAATIEGRLTCTRGVFDCPIPSGPGEPSKVAIEAISATIRGGMTLGWKTVSPSVDFTNARTSFLADDPLNWPSRFVISGFTYDRFQQPWRGTSGWTWDHKARCAWLSHQAAYDAGPYEQAARVFRQHGYTAGAEEILIAQRKHARQAVTGQRTLLRRVRDTAYSATLGYGYRPGRVLWLLALLLVLVAGSLEIPASRSAMRATTSAGTVYSLQGPIPGAGSTVFTGVPPHSDACGDGQVRCFSAVLYAIDTVLPLISLDQRSTWYPDPHVRGGTFMKWWLNAATLLGWLLSSIFVVSLARLARGT